MNDIIFTTIPEKLETDTSFFNNLHNLSHELFKFNPYLNSVTLNPDKTFSETYAYNPLDVEHNSFVNNFNYYIPYTKSSIRDFFLSNTNDISLTIILKKNKMLFRIFMKDDKFNESEISY